MFDGYSDWTAGLMAEELGFSRWQVKVILLLAEAPRPALEPIGFRIHSVPDTFSPWVKRPGCKADNSPSHSAEVNLLRARSHSSTASSFFMTLGVMQHRSSLRIVEQ